MARPIIEAKCKAAKAVSSRARQTAHAELSSASARAIAPVVRLLAVEPEFEGQRLDNFLLRELKGVPKTHVYRIIRSGEVRLNKGRVNAHTRVRAGDQIRLPPVRTAVAESADDTTAAPPREFPVLFEDDDLMAIDKPAGTAVHGGSGVSFGVIEQLRRARPQQRFLELVHRLDRETSGILLVAKKRRALLALQAQFRARETGKVYMALVVGHWPDESKVIDVALHKTVNAQGERRVYAVGPEHRDGQRSISLVRVIRHFAAASLLEVTIKTGRTHQIRVHLAHVGHVIVGDDKYGDFMLNRCYARGEGVAGVRFERMFLHARRLVFEHPSSGQRIELNAGLPSECERLLCALPS